MHQKSQQREPTAKVRGEAAGRAMGDEAKRVCSEPTNSGEALLEAALTRENMLKAWQRVKANKGSAGSDGLSIDATWERLKTHWSGIRESLLDGTYRPQPVRRVMISEAGRVSAPIGDTDGDGSIDPAVAAAGVAAAH